MKVKTLIALLQKCDPEAIVCAEVFCGPVIKVVAELKPDTCESYVYVGDDVYAVTEDWEDQGIEYTQILHTEEDLKNE